MLVAAAERVIQAVAACPAAAAAAWGEARAGMGLLLVERLAQLIWHCLRHPGALGDEAAMHRLEVRLHARTATKITTDLVRVSKGLPAPLCALVLPGAALARLAKRAPPHHASS